MGTNTPQYCNRRWILKFALVTIWMVLFFSRLEGHSGRHVQKQFVMWTHQTKAHFSTSCRPIFDELRHLEVSCVSSCWYMAFLFAFFDANAAIYLKCSGVRVVTSFIQSCLFLIHYHLNDQRLLAFNLGFQSGIIHAKNSLDSLNLLVILSIVEWLNSLKMRSKKCSQTVGLNDHGIHHESDGN